jgi:small conductance mechanosensitive channel
MRQILIGQSTPIDSAAAQRYRIHMFDLSVSVTTSLLNTALILIGTVFAQVFARKLIRRGVLRLESSRKKGGARSQRLLTLQDVLENVATVSVWAVAFVIILSAWHIDITPIITGAGIVGLAVGLGSQTLVRDLVSGLFILIENQYNVGDRVELVGVIGTVKEINLRTTILKGEDDSIHIIPNSQITKVTKNLPKTQPEEKTS